MPRPGFQLVTQQRLFEAEAHLLFLEGARIKTLERNNSLESRLRLLEARLSSDAVGSVSIRESRDSTRITTIKAPLRGLFSFFPWTVSTIADAGRTSFARLLQVSSQAEQPAALPPSMVLADSGTNTDAAAAVDAATMPSKMIGIPAPAGEDEVCPHLRASPTEKGSRDSNRPSFHFVTNPALAGYSQSLELVDDNESCDHGTGKLSDLAKILNLHTEADSRGIDSYNEPATGYEVLTAHHLKTCECCGSNCRHRPWGDRNVPGKKGRRTGVAPVSVSKEGNHSEETVAHVATSAAAMPSLKHDITVDAPVVAPVASEPVKGTVRPKSRVYTRKGDSGWGTLYNNFNILKSDPIYDAIGTIDELNSTVGFAAQMLTISSPPSCHRYDKATEEPAPRLKAHEELAAQLETVQAWLLDIGSSFCTPRTATTNSRKLQRANGICDTDVVIVEGWIDEADSQLARLTSFILPGGSPGATSLHVARTVCRRAERHTWPLLISGHGEEVIGIFLNRLSDFLLVAARLDAAFVGGKEQDHKIQFRVDRWQRQVVNV